MPQRALATPQSPDLPDHLVHMTTRVGKVAPELNPAIAQQSPVVRLASILWTGWLAYGYPLDGGVMQSACFTQTTPSALGALLSGPVRRYSGALGIAFHKQAVWSAGGAPVHYVRGDDWDDWQAAGLPDRVLGLGVRYWPGWDGQAPPEAGFFDDYWRRSRSEWMHEREWRIVRPRDDAGPGWVYPRDAVSHLLLGLPQEREEIAACISYWDRTAGDQLATAWFATLPVSYYQPGLEPPFTPPTLQAPPSS
ncbi:hypothetical protein Celgi_1733 [Cellulomonas gilvus ATCC 13127]|uniref:Uncharacterized protein n=2 Tax=Cellulomonas gilvus TaxID=11 RepID=F8A686_CELGA|nr:hypothetical protein Celgi_1733 [Cellulomonas gilvus ATCC 13127]